MEKVKKTRKTQEGLVVSDKMEKTVVVGVTRRVEHPLYKKYIRRTKKYFAHNESMDISVGDLVVIEESRPLSKNKRWVVKELVRKAS